MEEEKKRKRGMETEILETIAFTAAAALFISGMKLFLPLVFRRWSATTAPPPLFLILLLHLIVASIALVTIHQSLFMGRRSHGSKRKNSSVKAKSKWEDEEEEEAEDPEGVDADELNAKVEAFIKEFRQQLRIESFSSRFEASN